MQFFEDEKYPQKLINMFFVSYKSINMTKRIPVALPSLRKIFIAEFYPSPASPFVDIYIHFVISALSA